MKTMNIGKRFAVASLLLVNLFSIPYSSHAFTNPSPQSRSVSGDLRQPNQLINHPGSHHATSEHLTTLNVAKGKLDELRESYGEESRKFRRSFFTHDEWLKHRASDRFVKNLSTLVNSGVVRQLSTEVGIVTSVAIFACLWNNLFITGFVDFNGVEYEPMFKNVLPLMALPAAPFTYSSPALSLLLVFRTNVAYARWDEARKAWGVIVNHSRNLLRQGASWVTDETEPDPDLRRESLTFFCNSVWAFARSMQRHLWGFHEDDAAFQRDVRERLEPFEAEGLIKARHKPTRANHDLSRAINQLPITYLRRVEIDKSAIAFADAMGACDRIFSSPVPLFYTRHTARFLGIWTLLLPFALWEPFGASWNHIGMIPATAVISFFLFGIEELSIQLEEPFSILPLDKITGGISLSANEHLEWHFEEGKERKQVSTMYMSADRILE